MFKDERDAQARDFEIYFPFPIGDRDEISLPDDAIVSLSVNKGFDDEIYVTLASKSFVVRGCRLTKVAAQQLGFEISRVDPGS